MATLDLLKELVLAPPFATWILNALGLIIAYVVLLSIYRLTLHPLARYPGPLLAKLTTFYGLYHAYVGDMHLDVERLHRKYGTFVRYGPNAVVVGSVDGFHDIYDSGRNVRKSKSSRIHGEDNILGLRNKAKYARKKRIFNQIFSDAAIRGYENKVLETVEEFCTKVMPEDNGWTVSKDMSRWCNYLTLDIITKVVFTTTWSLLASPVNRGVIEVTGTVVKLLGVVHQSPWLYNYKIAILTFIPGLARSMPKLRGYTLNIIASSMEARKQNPDLEDAFAHLLRAKDPESKTGEGLGPADVRINCSNLLVAGSDTSSSALCSTFFYLSHNPEAYSKVATEVRAAFPSNASICAGQVLNDCVYLRAAINEAMRLAPVVAQPLWREVDNGGAMVAGQKIPAGYNVGAGIYTLHHNSDVFPSPYEYDIERWIVQEGKDAEEEKQRIKACQRSFAPFSMGPRQCIAKNFAMMELLLTIANVMWRFDFESEGRLGEGGPRMGKGRERRGEYQLKIYFTSHMEGPMIRFQKRRGVEDVVGN